MIRRFVLALVTIVLFSFSGAAQRPADTIPEFKFFKTDRTAVTDKDVKTGIAALFVFFDITCDHCRKAIQSLDSNSQKLKKTAVYLITVNDIVPTIEFIKRFGKKMSVQKNVTLLFDPFNQFRTKFHPIKYPSVFLYSSKRKLQMYADDEKDISLLLKKIKA